MYLPTDRAGTKAFSGVFGCDVDKDEFGLVNRVKIHPRMTNVWLIAKKSDSSMNINEFIEEYIKGPLDTSGIFSRNPPPLIGKVKLLPNDRETIRLEMASWGRRLGTDTLSDLRPTPNFEGPVSFYMVQFVPAEDAPRSLPWPVEGCVEDADIALSSYISDVNIATGQKETPAGPSTPATPDSVQKQIEESRKHLTAGSRLKNPSGGMSTTTLVLLGVGGAAAFIYAKEKGYLQR